MAVYKNKKRNKYNKYRRFIIVLVVFVCFFSFAWNGYIKSDFYTPDSSSVIPQDSTTPQDTTPLTSVTVTDSTGLLNSQQTDLLKKYAAAYALTLATMEAQDISPLYADTTSAPTILTGLLCKC